MTVMPCLKILYFLSSRDEPFCCKVVTNFVDLQVIVICEIIHGIAGSKCMHVDLLGDICMYTV